MSILNIITYNALAEMTKKSLYYKKSLTDKRFKYKIKYIIKLFNKVIYKVIRKRFPAKMDRCSGILIDKFKERWRK